MNHADVKAWRPAVVKWYSGQRKPGKELMTIALAHGIGQQVPAGQKDKVRALTLAGFEDLDLLMAVPDLGKWKVLYVSASIPKEVRFVFHAHLNGSTPLEISRLILYGMDAISRPKVYYWLHRLGLKPNRSVRDQTTDLDRASIVKLYHRGDRLTDIASRLNVSYDQVRYAVKLAGL